MRIRLAAPALAGALATCLLALPGQPTAAHEPRWQKEPRAIVGIPFGGPFDEAKMTKAGAECPASARVAEVGAYTCLGQTKIGGATASRIFTFEANRLVDVAIGLNISTREQAVAEFIKLYGDPNSRDPESPATLLWRGERITLRVTPTTAIFRLNAYQRELEASAKRR